MIQFTARHAGVALLASVGTFCLLAAIAINPLSGRLILGPIYIDRADVYLSFAVVSATLAILYWFLAARTCTGPSWLDGFSMTVLVVGMFIFLDRLLLSQIGLTIWKYDAELLYAHRPGIVRTLSRFDRPTDNIEINSWGHHDDEFPLEKPNNELRILVLGDSITMGYGLTRHETYSALLEGMLNTSSSDYRSVQVINTGVHGYSTAQQRIVFERSLIFQPDMIVLGFCMNDVTEPFIVDTRLGGTGLDYHGVLQSGSSVMWWIANETGYGRFAQRLAERKTSLVTEKRREVFDVKRMARAGLNDPIFSEPWQLVRNELSKIYDLAQENDLPVVLVVFPYDFQLIDANYQRPQQILQAHAAANHVPVIDIANTLRKEIFHRKELLEHMKNTGIHPEEILEYHRSRVAKFYFDDNHFTALGHLNIAEVLYQWVVQEALENNDLTHLHSEDWVATNRPRK